MITVQKTLCYFLGFCINLSKHVGSKGGGGDYIYIYRYTYVYIYIYVQIDRNKQMNMLRNKEISNLDKDI